MLYVELETRGSAVDTHSGRAPVAPNAAFELIWALSSLKEPQGHILIPGFYDDVQPWSDADLEVLAAMPDDEEAAMQRDLQLPGFLDGVHGSRSGCTARPHALFVGCTQATAALD